MIHRTLASAGAAILLGLGLASPAFPAALQQGTASATDLEGLVAGEIAAAPSREDLWSRALELRDAEQLGASGELDRILDRHLGKPQELSPEAILLLTTARIQGEDPDATLLADALTPVLAGGDEHVAMEAAGLLANSLFRALHTERRDQLVQQLLAGARDASHGPAYRLRFAVTAHEIGSGKDGRKAREEILGFLDSEDANLRAMGALALASLRGEPVDGRLRLELERLARVPDERGQLASAYLEQESLREIESRRLDALRQKYEGAGGGVPSELKELVTVLQMIENQHLEGADVDESQLLEAAMNGMLHWMDPHSAYFSSEAYAKFYQELEAEYGGIGAYVEEDPDNGLFTIVRPIYSGPAYHAGLMSDDKVVRIGEWPTVGKDVDDIIKRLKGEPGTKVKIYVWRDGMDPALIDRPTEDMAVEVERAKIEIPSGSNQLLPGKIGLAELDTFSDSAQKQLQDAIASMEKDGMRALVLDLRGNSGGLLTQAREVANLFLPKGEVVASTQGRGESQPEPLKTDADPMVAAGVPIVVLTSRFTASAAEIVSGALQDHGRAKLVGERTYGKGSVQQLIPVRWDGDQEDSWNDVNGNGIWDPWEPITVDHNGNGQVDYAPRVKLTVARYLLPSGRSIHRQIDRDGNVVEEGGVQPDVEIAPTLIDGWRYAERNRLMKGDDSPIKVYVDQHWEKDHELFGRLALDDGKDPSQYPDFDALVTQCATTLPRDDVRRLVRAEIRRRVQDDRGAEFPRGDFVEDLQLQKAIEIVLQELGDSVEAHPEYQRVFAVSKAGDATRGGVAAVAGPELSRVREIVREARDGGHGLSQAELDQVLGLLDDLQHN